MNARRVLLAVVAAVAGLAAAAPSARAADGDVIVTDPVRSFLGGSEGRVLRIAAAGGAPVTLAAGSPLRNPRAVAVDGAGRLLVIDESAEALFAVSPADGAVTVVASGAAFVDPVGLAVVDGVAFVSDRGNNTILRVDLGTGAVTTVARGGPIAEPDGIAVEPRGSLLVADHEAGGDGAILRIDPGTGAVTTLAFGALMDQPRDVAVTEAGSVFVTGDSDGGYVLRVDPDTGATTLLAAGAPLESPRGLGLQADGDLLVADRTGPDRGGVVRVDSETGALSVLSSGTGYFDPTGLAIVGGAGFADSGLSVEPPGPGEPGGPGGPGAPGGPGTPGGPAGGGGAGGTALDVKAPVLTKPKLKPTTFRAARRGASLSVAVGTTISYRLNEPARVRFTVQKYRHLSRVCKQRLAQTRHRTGTRCRRWVSLKGKFAKASAAGATSVRFTGRLNKRSLRPGSYRLVVRATDRTGNVTKPVRPTFHIVP